MAESDTWMPFYVADYLKDTRHLSTLEHGAYFLLIAHAWINGGALPKDERRLARIAGISPREWKQSGGVLMDFFQDAGDVWRHKRIDKELVRASNIIEQRRIAGRASAAARAAQREGQRKLNGHSTGVATNGQRNSRPSQSQLQEEENGSLSQSENSEAATAPGGAAPYAFEGRVIRLTRPDFDQWRQSYPDLDLPAVLQSRDDWLVGEADEATRKKWFVATSNHLKNLQQRATTGKREAQSYDRDRITV